MLYDKTITVLNITNNEVKKTVLEKCYVEEVRGSNIYKGTILEECKVYISIPLTKKFKKDKEYSKLSDIEKENYYTLISNKQDKICIGLVNEELSDFSSLGEYLKHIINEYYIYDVMNVDVHDFGSARLRHIEVGAV